MLFPNNKKQIKKGVFVNLSGSISLNLIKFISLFVITEFYGVESYGAYIFSLTLMLLFSILLLKGMDLAFIKFVHSDHGKKYFIFSIKRILKSFLFLFPVLAIVGFLIEEYFGKTGFFYIFLILSVFMITDVMLSMVVAVYKSRLEMIEQFRLLIIREVLFFLLVIVMASYSIPHGIALSLSIASIIVTSVAFYRIYLFQRDYFITDDDFKGSKEYLSVSNTLMYNSFVNRSLNSVDLVMAGLFLSPVLVGAYSIVLKITGILLMVQKSFRGILYPVYTKTFKKNGTRGIRSMFIKTTLLISAVTIFGAIILYIFSNTVLDFYSLSEIESINMVLVILLLARVVFSFSGTSGSVLITIGASKKFLLTDIISTLVLIISLIVLVPLYQIVGVSLALFISILIMTYSRIYYVKKYLF